VRVSATKEIATPPGVPPEQPGPPRETQGRSGLLAFARRWGPRIVGLLLFVIVLRSVGVGRVWSSLREANPWLFLISALAMFPFIAVKSWRWAGLAAGLGTPRIGWWEAFRLYSIGLWWGQATPGQAGDFVKAWYLRRRGAALAPALTSCILDRLFDFVALFALSGIALFAYAGGGRSVIFVALALVLVCGAIGAVVTERWRTPLLAFLAKLTPRPIRERLAGIEMFRSLTELRLDAGQLIPALGWTAVSWAISLVRVWLCFIALGVRLPIADFLILTLLQTLAALISIGGIGTRDAVLVAFLDRYGYSGGQAIAISFLILGLNLVNILPGFILWLRDPVPRGAVVEQDEEAGRGPAAGDVETAKDGAPVAVGER
jgi:uncharacterized protein (TIRG00374 family)